MKTRSLTLVVAGMLILPALTSAQEVQQHQGRMQAMSPQGMMMGPTEANPMMGMGLTMWPQPGPGFLLGQKNALELSDGQVHNLQQLNNELSEARETHVDKLTSLRQGLSEALSGGQTDLEQYQSALQSLANEYVAMQVEMARYSQKALAVLNDNQRSYVSFGMQMMHQMGENIWSCRQMMMQGGMMGGRMQSGMTHSRRTGGK